MIQEEIQNWIYEIKEVDALSAKALLRVYEQLGLSAAADRLGAISSEQTNVEYASAVSYTHLDVYKRQNQIYLKEVWSGDSNCNHCARRCCTEGTYA